MSEKDSMNRATPAEKIALGAGTAAAIGIAAGLFIARKTGAAMRRYTIGDGSGLMKEYWQVEYLKDSVPQTRYFHGTEAAVQRRIRHYKSDVQAIKKLDKSSAESILMEKKAHLIEL